MKLTFLILFILGTHVLAWAGSFFVKTTPIGQQQLNNPQFLKTAQIRLQTFQTFKQQIPVLKNWIVLTADSQQLSEFQNRQWIESFQPVGRFKVFPLTNDSLVGEQWYLKVIDIARAWQISQGTPDVLLAIIDTGIDYTHPDLQTSLWINTAELNGTPGLDDDHNGLIDDVRGWDFTDAPRFADGGDYLDPDPDPMDEFLGGHGTEIAGIIGATANNLRGIAGLAPHIKILNIRAGTASGYLEEDDVIQAMLYAYAMGARIINMSFGDVKISTLFRDVLHFLWQKGLTFVAAAGNEGLPQVYFPAALKETIAVGSSDSTDRLSSFSNFGYGIDLIAPGTEIVSTAPNNSYRTVSGTSFSAPMVGAVCALLLSANPALSNENIRAILRNTADQNLSNPSWQVGAGRLNAGKALQIQNGGNLQLQARTIHTRNNTFSVLLTASAYHPDLQSLTLRYGLGPHPENWKALKQWSFHYFYDDTLLLMPVNDLPDTLLTFQLQMELLNRTTINDQAQALIDRTPPRFQKLIFDPAFEGQQLVGLLHTVTDDPVKLKLLFLQAKNGPALDSLKEENEFAEHFVTLNEQEIGQASYLKLIATNPAGLAASTTVNIPELFFSAKLWRPWQEQSVDQAPLSGWLLGKTIDLNLNGRPEIVVSEYMEGGGIGSLNVFEFSDHVFQPLTSLDSRGFARDAQDVNGDGRPELLVTYGNHARLLQYLPQTNTFQMVWQDSNLWAGNLTDCNADGQFEIVGYRDANYLVLNNPGNFNFSPVAILENYSVGENRLGSPRVVVHDFNGDGQNELAFGDYDGDVLIFSCDNAFHFHLWQTLKSYQSDATNLLEVGDQSLFVLSHTSEARQFESDLAQLYWTLDIFKYDEQWRELRLTQRLHFFPYFSKKKFDAGLTFKKDHGRSFLFLSLYPNFYILEKIQQQWQVIWQISSCRSNAIIAQDLDQNGNLDVLFNNGEQLSLFSQNPETVLSAPFNLKARPLDSTRIQLSWQGVLYNTFRIYRGPRPDDLTPLQETTEKSYIDNQLSGQQSRYYYAVTALDDSLESPRSNVDSVEICPAPRLQTLQKIASHVFMLCFDQPVQIQKQPAARVFLKENRLFARSVTPLVANNALLAIFDLPEQVITPDTLIVAQVVNACQMPIHPQFDRMVVDLKAEIEAPRIVEIEVKNRNQVQLTFSQPMDSAQAVQVDHYQLWPWGSVQHIAFSDSVFMRATLSLSLDAPAGGFGQPVYLQVSGLKNRWQVAMAEAQKFSLFRPVEDLSQVIIYPQPLTAQDQELIFAKLPQKAEIHIFNINGLFVKTLKQVNDYGGLRWDLTDQWGKRVASGIYLYHISDGKQEKTGKLVIVR